MSRKPKYDPFLEGCVMFAGEEHEAIHFHNLYCAYYAEALEEERLERLENVREAGGEAHEPR